MKLNEYFNYIKSRLAFIPADFDRDYLTDYRANYAKYDFLMSAKFGELPLMSQDSSEVRNMILASCFMHDYQWKTQYNTTVLEYNPIWNVDGTETKTSVYGNAVENSAKGATKKTDVMGSRTASSSDDIYVNPFDSDTESHTGRTTNSNTLNSYTDTHNTDAVTDTLTKQEHTDTETLVRGGNIGVTSTQNLLTQEREVAYFNFIQIVMSDIINDITVPVWSDCDSDYAAGSDSTDYNILINKPRINNVELSGNKTAAELGLFSGSYNDLTDKPTLFSGSYNDLTDKPDIPSDAADITYNNEFSTLTADNVEMALDELDVKSENLKDTLNVHSASGTELSLETAKGGIRLEKIEGATVKDDSGLHVAGDMGLVDLSKLNWTLNPNWNGTSAYYTTDLSGKYKKVDNTVMPDMYSDSYTVMTRDGLYNGKSLKGICTDNTGTYITVRSEGIPSGYLAFEVADLAIPSQYAEVIKEHGKYIEIQRTDLAPTSWTEKNTLTITSGYGIVYVECQPNTMYTISKNVSNRFRVFDCPTLVNGGECTPLFNNDAATQTVVRTSKNAKYLGIYVNYNALSIDFDIQIAESKTIFVPTSQPLPEGDYINANGEYHGKNIKRFEELTWRKRTEVNGVFSSESLTDYARKNDIYAISDKYDFGGVITGISSATEDKKFYLYYLSSNNDRYIYIHDESLSDVSEIKGTFIYELATPTLTPLSNDQKISLNNLESFDGQTNITTADNLATLVVSYGKSDTVATALGADNQSKVNEAQIEENNKTTLLRATTTVGIFSQNDIYNQGDVYDITLQMTLNQSITANNTVIASLPFKPKDSRLVTIIKPDNTLGAGYILSNGNIFSLTSIPQGTITVSATIVNG